MKLEWENRKKTRTKNNIRKRNSEKEKKNCDHNKAWKLQSSFYSFTIAVSYVLDFLFPSNENDYHFPSLVFPECSSIALFFLLSTSNRYLAQLLVFKLSHLALRRKTKFLCCCCSASLYFTFPTFWWFSLEIPCKNYLFNFQSRIVAVFLSFILLNRLPFSLEIQLNENQLWLTI